MSKMGTCSYHKTLVQNASEFQGVDVGFAALIVTKNLAWHGAGTAFAIEIQEKDWSASVANRG